MRRRGWGLILFLFSFSAFAAPAPTPFKTGWEQPIDPNHDCKFVFKRSTVTIEIPGGDHDLDPKRKRFNAPRLLREMEGDFIIQVRVCASFRPSAKSAVDGQEPRVAAGLVLIPADKNCIRLEYQAYRRKEKDTICANFQMRGEQIFNMGMGWAVPWKPEAGRVKDEHAYLRLQRRGEFIYTYLSSDGENWTYSGFNVGVPGLARKVKAGLAGYSTSRETFNVRFDHFKLIRGRNKSK